MDNTNVDEMLIKKIAPKQKEIEEKYRENEGMSKDYFITLLLKYQFNHFNQIDANLKYDAQTEILNLKTDLDRTFNKNKQWNIGLNPQLVLGLKSMGVFF